MPNIPRLAAAYLMAGLSLACSDSGSDTTTPDAYTLIAINPEDFPSVFDGVRPENTGVCSGPNSQGAYVAELVDVSGVVDTDSMTPIPDFAVQSSPATACNRTVGFARAVEHREYVARVWTYADIDGDPATIDICTIDGTSIAVMRVNGQCTTVPATPVSQLRCYGWQKPSSAPPEMTGEPLSGAAGAASSSTGGAASKSCDEFGCPGVAIGYRTMTLHYCVAEPTP